MVLGVCSDNQLKGLIKERVIFADDKIRETQIQPSSLDLRLGSQAFRMPFSSVPVGGDFEAFLKDNASYELDLSEQGFLHRNDVYVVRLKEGLALPAHLAARANPKSSIGRTDFHVRLISDHGNSFDDIPAGYNGGLWLEFCSHSFDTIAHPGDSLSQLRVYDKGLEGIGRAGLEALHRDSGLLSHLDKRRDIKLSEEEFGNFVGSDRVYTTLELDCRNPGYVAKRNAPPIDLSKRDHPASAYFDRIFLDTGGRLVVDNNSFYILSSREVVSVPKGTCAEMSDVETASGEFRSHYAGFFDPSFSAQATLELRNYGAPFLLIEGQRIASLGYFPMKELPKVPYGEHGKGSHYQGQRGPRLAKFFDMNK